MALVAVLSNPGSTGNQLQLPKIRAFCARRSDLFHYELESVSHISAAIGAIAECRPSAIVINGGDGTVQLALTALSNCPEFAAGIPPIAVLPNGKTNLIALDLGMTGDPVEALDAIVSSTAGGSHNNVVQRELICLSSANTGEQAVYGMFLGGAGLADVILYCRNKIYPLGLSNGISHVIAGFAFVLSLIFGAHGKHLPPKPRPVQVTLKGKDAHARQFAFIIVTTLDRLLLNSHTQVSERGLRFLAVERSVGSLVRALVASVRGKLGTTPIRGVHFEHSPEIWIESDDASIILDGETYTASRDHPIILRASAPVNFVSMAQ